MSLDDTDGPLSQTNQDSEFDSLTNPLYTFEADQNTMRMSQPVYSMDGKPTALIPPPYFD